MSMHMPLFTRPIADKTPLAWTGETSLHVHSCSVCVAFSAGHMRTLISLLEIERTSWKETLQKRGQVFFTKFLSKICNLQIPLCVLLLADTTCHLGMRKGFFNCSGANHHYPGRDDTVCFHFLFLSHCDGDLAWGFILQKLDTLLR